MIMYLLLMILVFLGFSNASAKHAKICEHNVADIHFLLDASISVGSKNFQKQKDFVSHFVQSITIGPQNVLVGLTTFSTRTHPQFLLKDHLTKSSLITAINAVPYQTGHTHMGQALQWVDHNAFTATAGHRSGVVKILIAITNKGHELLNRTSHLTATEAEKLHKEGVEVFVIGIGIVNISALGRIATDHSHMFTAQSYDSLHTLRTELNHRTCTGSTDTGRIDPDPSLFG